MTLPVSLPPEYVTTPAWVIASAFSYDPPKRALLGSYNRLLSLAWNSKDRTTPTLREEFFYDGPHGEGFLRVSRRQFYQIVSEMEGMRWLRLARPRAGFVQFVFHGSDPDASAKNRIDVQKSALDLMRIEEEESLKLKDSESSSSSSEKPVRKIALTAKTDSEKKMQTLIENLHLLFDPELYGLLEMREIFLAGIPERALGWIAKAYQDRERLVQGGGPLGLIVKHLIQRDEPHRYFLEHYAEILPESYLEAVGELEIGCEYCTDTFSTRAELDTHQKVSHPFPCTDCPEWFMAEVERKTHWLKTHDLYRVQDEAAAAIVPMPVLDGTMESTWQAVLHQLQVEMPRASFDTWVRDTAPVRYDGNVLTIGARNLYARDWLTNRLTARVNAILAALSDTSETPIVVSFVVAQGESV